MKKITLSQVAWYIASILFACFVVYIKNNHPDYLLFAIGFYGCFCVLWGESIARKRALDEKEEDKQK